VGRDVSTAVGRVEGIMKCVIVRIVVSGGIPKMVLLLFCKIIRVARETRSTRVELSILKQGNVRLQPVLHRFASAITIPFPLLWSI
jgi:hypothetical protein